MRLLLFIFIALSFCSNLNCQEIKMSANDFNNYMFEKSSNIILDVRTKEEYEAGHISNSINIDWSQTSFDSIIDKLDKKASVFIYCLSGGRSNLAAKKLHMNGFHRVYELEEGILAWKKAKLPLVKGQYTQAVQDLSLSDFEKLYKGKKKKILFDFYADWCFPCRKMKPVLDELETENASEIEIIRLNSDKYPNLFSELGITALPCFILYNNDKLVWKRFGFMERAELKNLIFK